jgi:hypothetical protein
MRTYLLAAACLALASCAAQKALPQYTEAQKQAQRENISYWQPDTAHPATPPHAEPRMKPSFSSILPSINERKIKEPENKTAPVALKGLFSFLKGRKATKETVQNSPYPAPKKCKGCVFNTVAGDQSNAGKKATVLAEGATNIGKAKAPVATGEARATDQSGTGAASTIEGNGNAPVLTNTAPPKRSWQEALADNLTGPLGWVVGLVALAGVGYGIYYFWFLIPRRKASTDTPTV